jgi:hypothetical protein
MSSTHENPPPSITNPLQTNNSALMIIGYAAGVCAAKFPIFDLATWNYIFISAGGLIFTIGTVLLNRKSAVVSTVANMAEVKNVDLDKTVKGAGALSDVTPNNVVVK